MHYVHHILLGMRTKGTPLALDSLCVEVHTNLDGSTSLVELFFTAILNH